MMEKILEIKETSFDNKDGFIITTDKQVVKLGIDNCQSCCENWGYFMSEDDISAFVGAYLLDIKVTDTLMKPNSDFDVNGMYEGGVMFVNIETSKGLLQFVAYNEHNGYYGHEACVISSQVSEAEFL